MSRGKLSMKKYELRKIYKFSELDFRVRRALEGAVKRMQEAQGISEEERIRRNRTKVENLSIMYTGPFNNEDGRLVYESFNLVRDEYCLIPPTQFVVKPKVI